MNAYLDTDVVSAIFKDDNRDESAALDRALRAFNDDHLNLVTSDDTRKEIDNHKGSPRAGIEQIVRLLRRVPHVDSHQLLRTQNCGHSKTRTNSTIIGDDPTVRRLRELGIGPSDALHLMVAIKAQCDIFLTCDRGVLHRSREIQADFQIEPMKPSALCAREGW
jgi:hypothetical protein